MTTGTIYCFTNLQNQKKYVGQTTQNPQQRFREHQNSAKHGSKDAFHRAIRKYGIDQFSFELIDTAQTLEELNQKEIEWIQKLSSHTYKHGYNMKFGGSHGPLTEEIKRKISEAKKGKKTKRIYPKGKDHHGFGKRRPESQKRKVAKALASNWEITFPDGHKEKISNLRQFCREHQLSDSNFHIYGHTKGYKAHKIDSEYK